MTRISLDTRDGAEPALTMEETTALAAAAARRHIIKRPRLTRLLDDTEARIILLVAPAGYGKTTLAREWLAQRPAATHVLSDADQDVVVLATGLTSTLASRGVASGLPVLRHLRATKGRMVRGTDLAEILLQDIAAPNAQGLTLWLDDYHVVKSAPESEAFVERIAKASPFRMIIGSRERPTWIDARSVLYGEVREIGRTSLAMSEEEASKVLGTTDLVGVVALADGWPAVVGLAALLNGRVITPESIPSELHDFFAQELLASADTDLQRDVTFLARLPRITPSAASLLFGDRANAIVADASRRGFFSAVSTDGFEIHPLLRDFLIRHRPSLDESELASLGRVGETLIDDGRWDEAFALAQEIQADGLFLRLIEAALSSLLSESRGETLRRWLAWGRTRGLSAAVLDLADAEIAFRTGDLRRSELLSSSCAARLPKDHPLRSQALYRAGQAAHFLDLSERARAHYIEAAEAALDQADLRLAIWGHFNLMTEYDAEEAADLLGQFEAASDGSPDNLMRFYTGTLALGARLLGLEGPLQTARSAHALLSDADDPLVVAGFLHMHSWCLMLAARYPESKAISATFAAHIARHRLDFVEPHAQLQGALIAIGMRKYAEADRLLTGVQLAGERLGDIHLGLSAATHRLHLRASEGALERGLHELARVPRAAPDTPLFNEYAAAVALVSAGLGRSEEALSWIRKSEAAGAQMESRVLNLWARAILELSAPDSSALQESMSETGRTGNYNSLVLAYRTAPGLLEALIAHGLHEEVTAILARAGDRAIARSVGIRLNEKLDRAAPGLTKREQEIHELLCRGLSNREIASALFISEVTVKAHLRHIYEKLGVTSRTQAVLWRSPD